MADIGQRFCNALAFFTRLPIPAWVEHSPAHQRRAVCFAPLIGCLVAAAVALVFLLGDAFLPSSLAVLLALAVAAWLTGALHEDGFADVCDGFGASRDPARVLEIMQDPRCGAFGVLGLTLLILAKFAALSELAGAANYVVVAVLLGAHSLSRMCMVSVMYFQDYAALGQSKSGPIASPVKRADFCFSAVCGLLPVLLLAELGLSWIVLTLSPVLLVCCGLAWWFQRRLGGYTGDCLGCVQKVSETVFYFGACAALRSA